MLLKRGLNDAKRHENDAKKGLTAKSKSQRQRGRRRRSEGGRPGIANPRVGAQGLARHRLAIADGSCALPIQTEDTAPVKPGDTVELQGFPVMRVHALRGGLG
jgi:hypothetical protein